MVLILFSCSLSFSCLASCGFPSVNLKDGAYLGLLIGYVLHVTYSVSAVEVDID